MLIVLIVVGQTDGVAEVHFEAVSRDVGYGILDAFERGNSRARKEIVADANDDLVRRGDGVEGHHSGSGLGKRVDM